MSISALDFDYVRNVVRQSSAIVLEDGKEYLVEARLTPLLRGESLQSLDQLVSRMRAQPGSSSAQGLKQRVVEAMTTNETSFFRDMHPFEALRKTILPDLIAKRKDEKKLSIWCGASSTGQEPYTLAMLLCENFPELASWTVSFVASDLSTEVLGRARSGVFNQLEVNRGLPARMLVKYFTQKGTEFHIREDLRKMIDFRCINLVEPWPAMPGLDLVMMRNVMIYFDTPTKKNILQRVRRLMRPNGYLVLGGAETTINLEDTLEQVRLEKFTCYRVRQT
jgi:chemotaxis protein methyltransferase CheR